MKNSFEIEVHRGGVSEVICFGMPTTDEELREMYKGRYTAYLRKGHLVENKEKLDIDLHDKKGSCKYFIAKMDDRIIGSLRIIKEDPLPTEKDYYQFPEPEKIKKIQRDKRIEIGRLVSNNEKGFLPRHIVLLGLFYAALKFAKEEGFGGGYGTLKDYVKAKLDKISFPIHEINGFVKVYDFENSKDPLVGFFDEAKGATYPVYFIQKEASNYLENMFKFALKKKSDHRYLFKGNLMFYIFFIFSRIKKGIDAF